MLLAARERGYRSLMKLNSRAFQETPVNQTPHIKFDWLEGEAEDVIALTGGPDGPIALALQADQARWRRSASTGWPRCSATGSTSNCSATASTRSAGSRAG